MQIQIIQMVDTDTDTETLDAIATQNIQVHSQTMNCYSNIQGSTRTLH